MENTIVSSINIIKESSRGYSVLPLDATALMDRQVYLDTGITAESATEICRQLRYLDSDQPGENITLYLNTNGGEVYSGLQIYDCIRSLSSPVTIIVSGVAASMGAIILLAADPSRRKAYEHSRIMIHQPRFNNMNISGMIPCEIEKLYESLNKTSEELLTIIAERTCHLVKDVRRKTQVDCWFNVEQAMDYGMISEIIYNDEKGVN